MQPRVNELLAFARHEIVAGGPAVRATQRLTIPGRPAKTFRVFVDAPFEVAVGSLLHYDGVSYEVAACTPQGPLAVELHLREAQ
jgi:hypothetical protein